MTWRQRLGLVLVLLGIATPAFATTWFSANSQWNRTIPNPLPTTAYNVGYCMSSPGTPCTMDADCPGDTAANYKRATTYRCYGGTNAGNACTSYLNCPGGSCQAWHDYCEGATAHYVKDNNITVAAKGSGIPGGEDSAYDLTSNIQASFVYPVYTGTSADAGAAQTVVCQLTTDDTRCNHFIAQFGGLTATCEGGANNGATCTTRAGCPSGWCTYTATKQFLPLMKQTAAHLNAIAVTPAEALGQCVEVSTGIPWVHCTGGNNINGRCASGADCPGTGGGTCANLSGSLGLCYAGTQTDTNAAGCQAGYVCSYDPQRSGFGGDHHVDMVLTDLNIGDSFYGYYFNFKLWDTIKSRWNTDAWDHIDTSSSGTGYNTTWPTTGWINAPAVTSKGTANLTTSVKPWELDAGTIPHKLGLVVARSPCTGDWYPPAVAGSANNGAYCQNAYGVFIGQTLQLDPALDCADATMSLTPDAQTICRALQAYGGVIEDWGDSIIVRMNRDAKYYDDLSAPQRCLGGTNAGAVCSVSSSCGGGTCRPSVEQTGMFARSGWRPSSRDCNLNKCTTKIPFSYLRVVKNTGTKCTYADGQTCWNGLLNTATPTPTATAPTPTPTATVTVTGVTPTATPTAAPPQNWTNANTCWWNLDDAANGDRLALGASGASCTLTNRDTVGQDTSTQQEGAAAAVFSGGTDRLSDGSESQYDLTTAGSWGGWVKVTTEQDYAAVLARAPGSGAQGYALYAYGAIHKFSCNAGNGVIRQAVAPSTYATGTWYHVLCTASGTALKLYINGTEVASTVYVGPLIAYGTIPVVGDGLIGSLDEMALVNGYALSATETCRVCSCGIQGKQCTCNATTPASYDLTGRNIANGGVCNCTLPACDAAPPNGAATPTPTPTPTSTIPTPTPTATATPATTATTTFTATPTITPSATVTPIATATPYPGNMTAPYGQVSVNGVAEPSMATAITITNVRGVVGYYQCRWNETFLSCSATVADPYLNAAGIDLWTDDAWEWWIDTQNDRSATLDANDYKVILNIQNAAVTYQGWTEPALAGFTSAVSTTGTINDDSDVDSGYTLEWRVPWASLGVTPTSGMVFGFNSALDDRWQIPVGYSETSWTGAFNTPSLWGTLTLGDIPAGIRGGSLSGGSQ